MGKTGISLAAIGALVFALSACTEATTQAVGGPGRPTPRVQVTPTPTPQISPTPAPSPTVPPPSATPMPTPTPDLATPTAQPTPTAPPSPAPEKCDDGVDNDLDGFTDCADQDPDDCLSSTACPERCGDAIDNDADGFRDCDDADCRPDSTCPEICDDGFDNDGNGRDDCDDPACFEGPACVEKLCSNMLDDDLDGFTDCEDDDCLGVEACNPVERCDSGVDDDDDGLTDCEDPDCQPNVACPEDCLNGRDDDADALIDCDDSDCQPHPTCPERCDDGIDNDGNGDTDCDDELCIGQAICPEVCDDDIDNNNDGNTDCDDPECDPSSKCPERCFDGRDNDADQLVDCDDPDCPPHSRCDEVCFGGRDDDDDGATDCEDSDCASDRACVCRPAFGIACGGAVMSATDVAESTDAIHAAECGPWDLSGDELTVDFSPDAHVLATALLTPEGREDELLLLLSEDYGLGCDTGVCTVAGLELTWRAYRGFPYHLGVDGIAGAQQRFTLAITACEALVDCGAEPCQTLVERFDDTTARDVVRSTAWWGSEQAGWLTVPLGGDCGGAPVPGVGGLPGVVDAGRGDAGAFMPDGDTELSGDLHFTDIIIPPGVTVRAIGDTPLQLHATGEVIIGGVLELSGAAGENAGGDNFDCDGGAAPGGAPGPGGFAGGVGGDGWASNFGCAGAEAGEGPGGGGPGVDNSGCASVRFGSAGGGGGHASEGDPASRGGGLTCGPPGAGGAAYGDFALATLTGGSGGGGAGGDFTGFDGPSGGGGGGVLTIDAAGFIQISGEIRANGGAGGNSTSGANMGSAGGGAGGAVRLRSDSGVGCHLVSAAGGAGGTPGFNGSGTGGTGGLGHVRIEDPDGALGVLGDHPWPFAEARSTFFDSGLGAPTWFPAVVAAQTPPGTRVRALFQGAGEDPARPGEPDLSALSAWVDDLTQLSGRRFVRYHLELFADPAARRRPRIDEVVLPYR